MAALHIQLNIIALKFFFQRKETLVFLIVSIYFKHGVQPKFGVQDEKCGVQNGIFTSRSQLFWALSHSIQSSLNILQNLVAIT